MKKLNLFVLLMAFSIGSVMAFPTTERSIDDPRAVFSKEIANLISLHKMELDKDLVVIVKFVVNKENEIVILTVDTEDSEVKSFVKSALNYKKVKTELDETVKEYTLPLRIKA